VAALLQTLGGIFGEEYELRTLHKLLHVFSKTLFYVALTSLFYPLVQVIRNHEFGVLLLHDKVVSYAVSLSFIIVSLAVAFVMKESFASSLLSDLHMNLKGLSEVISMRKPKTPFLEDELLPVFSDYLSGYLEGSVSFRKIIKLSYVRVSMLIDLLVMPFAVLILLVSNGYEPIYPWYIPLFLASLALLVSSVNAWLIISTCQSRGVGGEVEEERQAGSIKRSIIRESVNLLLLTSLARYKYRIGGKLGLKEKILMSLLFSIGLMFIVNPGDLLISSRKKEDLESQFQLRKVAFVFIPSSKEIKGFPGMCSEDRRVDESKLLKDGDIDLLSKICRIAYREVNLTSQYVENPKKSTLTICTSIDWREYRKLERVHEEIIQRSELVLSDLRKRVSTMLNGWMIEFLTFEDLKNLLKDEGGEEVIERLYRYSIIETTVKTWSTLEILDKLWGLFSDKELLNGLGDLAEEFVFILPIINIHTEPMSTIRVPSREHYRRVFFITYYCIPVLIALNPLMNLRDFEEIYDKIKMGKS